MATDIEALIGRRQTGYSLPGPFYTDMDVYRQDVEHVFSKLWMLAGHVSQIPEPGDYFLAEIAGESICIVRRGEGEISAFYNVCRHRGSRICREQRGNTQAFVCPYHAWSYNLDGSLRAARLMPEDFAREDMGLHPCHVLVYEGLIFICLAEDSPPDVDSILQQMEPFIKPQNLRNAKVIHETVFGTNANWKLVVENFWECYHCQPSHPEFMAVHDENWVLAMGAGLGACVSEQAEVNYQQEFKAFEDRARQLDHPFGSSSKLGLGSTEFWQVLRSPLADGCYSETRDGRKVGPLMGDLNDFDGGMTHISFNPLASLWLCNDHAVTFNFHPMGPMSTDVHIMWLVDREAEEDRDFTVEDVAWMWTTTGLQDKTITENNQSGVNSSRYQPGPYSLMEGQLEDFVQWYFARLREADAAS